MKSNLRIWLKFFYVYQVTSWLLGIIVLVKESYKLILDNGNSDILFISALILFLSCFVIYINFCLLFNLQKEKRNFFLIFNKWIIFIQIFQLSLLGFTAYFVVGTQLGFVYSYREAQSINFIFNFYRFDIALNYHDSNSILIAINFLPIAIFIWLNKIIQNTSSS